MKIVIKYVNFEKSAKNCVIFKNLQAPARPRQIILKSPGPGPGPGTALPMTASKNTSFSFSTSGKLKQLSAKPVRFFFGLLETDDMQSNGGMIE